MYFVTRIKKIMAGGRRKAAPKTTTKSATTTTRKTTKQKNVSKSYYYGIYSFVARYKLRSMVHSQHSQCWEWTMHLSMFFGLLIGWQTRERDRQTDKEDDRRQISCIVCYYFLFRVCYTLTKMNFEFETCFEGGAKNVVRISAWKHTRGT